MPRLRRKHLSNDNLEPDKIYPPEEPKESKESLNEPKESKESPDEPKEPKESPEEPKEPKESPVKIYPPESKELPVETSDINDFARQFDNIMCERELFMATLKIDKVEIVLDKSEKISATDFDMKYDNIISEREDFITNFKVKKSEFVPDRSEKISTTDFDRKYNEMIANRIEIPAPIVPNIEEKMDIEELKVIRDIDDFKKPGPTAFDTTFQQNKDVELDLNKELERITLELNKKPKSQQEEFNDAKKFDLRMSNNNTWQFMINIINGDEMEKNFMKFLLSCTIYEYVTIHTFIKSSKQLIIEKSKRTNLIKIWNKFNVFVNDKFRKHETVLNGKSIINIIDLFRNLVLT